MRLSWFDLARDDDRAAARAACRGKAGVYLLRRKGSPKIHYIGSSEPGAIQRRRAPDPARMWKTINRHFQACHTKGVYAFGSDNWCTSASARRDYELALVLTATRDARRVEADLIMQHRPTANAEIDRQRGELEAGGAGAEADDGIPF